MPVPSIARIQTKLIDRWPLIHVICVALHHAFDIWLLPFWNRIPISIKRPWLNLERRRARKMAITWHISVKMENEKWNIAFREDIKNIQNCFTFLVALLAGTVRHRPHQSATRNSIHKRLLFALHCTSSSHKCSQLEWNFLWIGARTQLNVSLPPAQYGDKCKESTQRAEENAASNIFLWGIAFDVSKAKARDLQVGIFFAEICAVLLFVCGYLFEMREEHANIKKTRCRW